MKSKRRQKPTKEQYTFVRKFQPHMDDATQWVNNMVRKNNAKRDKK